MTRKSWLSATAVVGIGHVIAGLLHYAYQVHAARTLPVEALGELGAVLSVWTWVAVAAVAFQVYVVMRPNTSLRPNTSSHPGTSLQPNTSSASNKSSNETRSRRRWFFFAGAALVLGVVVRSQSPWIEMLWTVPTLFAFHGCVGRIQRAQNFGWFALTSIAVAFGKWGSAIRVDAPSVVQFSEAIGFGLALGLLVAVVGVAMLKRSTASAGMVAGVANGAGVAGRSLWFWSLLPASSQLVLPSNDLLAFRFFLGSTTAGLLNQTQLFSKILFFGPVALLQVAVSVLSATPTDQDRRGLRRLNITMLLLLLLGSTVLSTWTSFPILGTIFAKIPIPFPGREIVGLSCLTTVPLFFVLEGIQRHAIARRPIGLWMLAIAVIAPWCAARMAQGSDASLHLERALQYNLVIMTALCLGAWGWSTASARQRS